MAKKAEEFLLNPGKMPGVDYYLETLKETGSSYPKCSNHAETLTIEGFCNAANALIKPFGKALKKARALNAAK
jgi:hypothetical protein